MIEEKDERKEKSQTSQGQIENSTIIDVQDNEEESTGASGGDSDSTSESNKQAKNQPKTREKIIFEGSGEFVKYWNNFVIILAMYNSIIIPVQIFYKDKGHSALRGSVITCMDAFVDLFFLFDIIIRFRTSFLDTKQSIEVRDPHIIAKKYLKGVFFLDFISSVPFATFASESTPTAVSDLLDALGLLKLLRLSRLFTTVQRSNLAQDIKVYLKVIMMAIILLVFIHVLSCVWFSVAV